jgi:hypothetical protein
VIDARTATPQGQVPQQDIIGSFEVKAGQLVDHSYKKNPNHVLLSKDGFFRLPSELREALRAELTRRNSKTPEPDRDGQQQKEKD